jgi:hypothetical protein
VVSQNEIRVYLRLFKNGMLRKIFGPEGEQVTGSGRKVHYE